MHTPASRRRPGFTLVELILVMAIIALLSSLAVGGFRVAVTARKKARAKGEVQALIMACENFKKTYGDYPCAKSGTTTTNSDSFRRQLFDQLLGRKVLKSVALASGTAIVQIDYDDPSYFGTGARRQKSFLSLGNVATNNDATIGDNDWRGGNPATFEFRDPWDNPYGYRYRILNSPTSSAVNVATGAPTGIYANWKSSNFLIVCAANKFNETVVPLHEDEFWDPTGSSPMTTSGMIPSTYFDDTASGLRSDNIVNWQNN